MRFRALSFDAFCSENAEGILCHDSSQSLVDDGSQMIQTHNTKTTMLNVKILKGSIAIMLAVSMAGCGSESAAASSSLPSASPTASADAPLWHGDGTYDKKNQTYTVIVPAWQAIYEGYSIKAVFSLKMNYDPSNYTKRYIYDIQPESLMVESGWDSAEMGEITNTEYFQNHQEALVTWTYIVTAGNETYSEKYSADILLEE